MKTYKLKDGGIITASSPETFLMRLRESSKFDSERTDEEYMTRFAERYKVQTEEEIKTDNPDIFLSELMRVGYIIEFD